VKVVPQKGGKKAYQWITTIDGLLTMLQTVNKVVAQQSQPKGNPVGRAGLETGVPQKQ
jgi:hypothetical protein